MLPKKSRHPTRCSVFNCTNTSNIPGIHFYRVPNATIHKYKQERRDKWISLVRRVNLDGSPWKPHENSRICSQHFINNEKSENPLNPSYNPSIFPKAYHKSKMSVISATAATKRFERAAKRKKQECNKISCKNMSREFTLKTHDTKVIKDLIFNAIRIRENAIPRTIDQETQVDFMTDDNMEETFKNFTCNRYIYIDSTSFLISDAEVQAYIPDCADQDTFFVKKHNTTNKNCETSLTCEERKISTETYDCESKGLLKWTRGFHIFDSG